METAPQRPRVRLMIPADIRERKSAKHDGEQYGHHGASGTVVCGAGSGGVWVRFDGQQPRSYVGCNAAWLETL